MTTQFVQFSDSTKTQIITVFGCAQDTKDYSNQGTIDSSDPIYLAFINPSSTLAGAKLAKISLLSASYDAAIQLPVSYMATTFQADNDSQVILTKCLVAGSVPAGFAWLDANNNAVSMTFTQLQGLAGAMLAQGQAAFVKLQTLKTQVRSATTVASIGLIVW